MQPDRLVVERPQNSHGVQDEVHQPADVSGPLLGHEIIAEAGGGLELPAQVHWYLVDEYCRELACCAGPR